MTNKDKVMPILFLGATILFIGVCARSPQFMRWAFERHRNQWSWYVRPLMLIPYCLFAHRKSLTGISFTVFCLFTSMIWFEKPAVANPRVNSFLEFEQQWLYGSYDVVKIMLLITVPISFIALACALWKRSLWIGMGVVTLMALGKIIWSSYSGGDSGKAILMPAFTGLLLCVVFIIFILRKIS